MLRQNNQSGWMVERPGDPSGRLEAVAVCSPPRRGLTHFWHDHSLSFYPGEIWNAGDRIRSSGLTGPFRGAALVLTNYGNLQLVATQTDGALAHFWFCEICGWQDETFLPGKAAGPPAFIQSRFGHRGNFEVIVPRPGGGLSHFWRDNDGIPIWHTAQPPATTGTWSGVGLSHTSFGNLAAVGVRNGILNFLWQEEPGGSWSIHPITIAQVVCGRPAFVQSSNGVRGNFEVVVAKAAGRLAHYWRNNDVQGFPWLGSRFLPPSGNQGSVFDDVTMIESSYGRLEVLAREATASAFVHYRAALGQAWEGPVWGPPMPYDP
jgi:hypothetical protein